jgi:hypothetical protein
MRRREFIGLVGGAAVTLQRRIGVFMNLAANHRNRPSKFRLSSMDFVNGAGEQNCSLTD